MFKRILSVICVLLVACTMLSLAACNDQTSDSTPDESTIDSTAAYLVDNSSEINSSTAETSSTATATSSTAATTSTAENSTASQNSGSSQTNVETPVTVNPDGEEIIGAGSASQPYLETPDSNMTVTTVKVPAGKALYYDIYRVGGKILTINDSNAYVIYNGTRYNSSGGRVSFVVGSALASEAVSFQIGNSGSSAKSFVISFTDTYGSHENPEIISKFNGTKYTTSLSAGNDTGYYYKYTAEKTGTIRFYVENDLEEFLFYATRNKSSDGMLIPIQRSFSEEVLSDSKGNYIELEVEKGETVVINISSYPMGSYYPAVTVNWYGIYA